MADLWNLVHRNAALETELRLVKEQLTQAHNANQYLLHRMSDPQNTLAFFPRQGVAPQTGIETQGRAIAGRIGARKAHDQTRRDSLIDHPAPVEEGPADYDLLSFDDPSEDDAPAKQTTTAEHIPTASLPRTYDEEGPSASAIPPASAASQGSGGRGNHESSEGNVASDDPSSEQPASSSKQHGFYIKQNNGKSVFVSTQAPEPRGDFRIPHPAPFHHREHARLMGMACFLEDKADDEMAEFWMNHAAYNPRHSAVEYQTYFDTVIRPAYEETMRAREVALGSSGYSVDKSESTSQGDVDAMRACEVEVGNSENSSSMDKSESTGQGEMATTLPAAAASASDEKFEERQVISAPIKVDLNEAERIPGYHRSDHRPSQAPMSIEDLFAQAEDDEEDAMRTIVISGIPPNIILSSVLDAVRGGTVYKAEMLVTAGMRTTPPIETNSVMITFIHGRDAQNTAHEYTAERALSFSSTEGEAPSPATVQLITTVSRPIPWWTSRALRQHNLTRVLFIHDHHQRWQLDQVVRQIIATRPDVPQPLKAFIDPEVVGLMLLEFASMSEAKAAWDAVNRNYYFFQDVSRGFAVDPCSRSFLDTARAA
jgi:hypothetical protein